MELKAYLLIETSVGKSLEVARALSRHVWVESVERLAGPYDVVAVVAGHSKIEVNGKIEEALGRLDGIIRTAICPISA